MRAARDAAAVRDAAALAGANIFDGMDVSDSTDASNGAMSDGSDADLHREGTTLFENLGREMEIELVGRLDTEPGDR